MISTLPCWKIPTHEYVVPKSIPMDAPSDIIFVQLNVCDIFGKRLLYQSLLPVIGAKMLERIVGSNFIVTNVHTKISKNVI